MSYLYLCPFCLVLAAIFIVVERAERYVEADVIKGLASLTFVLLGFLGAGGFHATPYAAKIVVGLLVGAIADVLLNLRYVFEGKKGQAAFLVGILVFLIGHLIYLWAILPTCRYWGIAVAAGLVCTGALMMWIFQRIEATLPFKIFGIFYIGAIAILNCMAVLALIQHPSAHTIVFLVGVVLFLMSDVILILNTFGPKKSFVMRVSNLMLYYVGQLIIALSLQLL